MIVGIPQETFPGESRVALIPSSVPPLAKAGIEVHVQAGAGVAAGYPDHLYVEKGAKIAASRDEVFAAEIILQVRAGGANPEQGKDDLRRLAAGKIVIGLCDPLGQPKANRTGRHRGHALRTRAAAANHRAQGMDVLSSQATIAGYRAALLGAMALPKIFPMLITAAGTISAAKVFVIGAGVAGLQAIATAQATRARRSRPITSAPPPRSRSPVSARRWWTCRWTARPLRAKADMPKRWTKSSTASSRSCSQRRLPAAMW